MTIKAILAIGENGEIGWEGELPWGRNLPKDLAYFKRVTDGGYVIMGRNTYESLPHYPKGLPNRHNLVLTSQLVDRDWRFVHSTGVWMISQRYIEKCLHLHENDVWLIGGAKTYEALWDYVDEVHLTRVKASFPEADTFFTPDLTDFQEVCKFTDVSSDLYEAYVSVWRRKQ